MKSPVKVKVKLSLYQLIKHVSSPQICIFATWFKSSHGTSASIEYEIWEYFISQMHSVHYITTNYHSVRNTLVKENFISICCIIFGRFCFGAFLPFLGLCGALLSALPHAYVESLKAERAHLSALPCANKESLRQGDQNLPALPCAYTESLRQGEQRQRLPGNRTEQHQWQTEMTDKSDTAWKGGAGVEAGYKAACRGRNNSRQARAV